MQAKFLWIVCVAVCGGDRGVPAVVTYSPKYPPMET
jgi:hypothetical protein